MRPYYRTAKRNFRNSNDRPQIGYHALQYEYKLTPNEVFEVCSYYPDLYNELQDEIYGPNKLACSIYHENEDEFQRLSKMGFKASQKTLDVLLDYIINPHSRSGVDSVEYYFKIINKYQPYFGESFPLPIQLKGMIQLRLGRR